MKKPPTVHANSELAARLAERALTHLQWFVNHAPMSGFGPQDGPLWMSSLDLVSGKPRGPERPESIEKRCYRSIESPWGSNLYWDLPLLSACHLATEISGNPLFAEGANAYTREYLARCTSSSGLFWWANHYYFDAKLGIVVFFVGGEDSPHPIASDESCSYHETRPLRVPWELLWRISPQAVEKSIRTQGLRHVLDAVTGEFNRHADNLPEHPFLEAGGILAESLCWLGAKLKDESLVDLAEKVLNFNFRAADSSTGLLPVSPRKKRWDFHTATSETGLWAGCALRCHRLTARASFLTMAATSMAAWQCHAWDPDTNKFFGRLNVKTGAPDRSPKITPYQPGEYCDPWEPLFPAHDYPLQCAETCLELHRLTAKDLWTTSLERWLQHFDHSLPSRDGRGGYAEHYGRMLHWATGMEAAGWNQAGSLKQKLLAEIANELLFEDRLFRSHPGENRCDAVDGMGFLLWALLENGSPQPRVWEPW